MADFLDQADELRRTRADGVRDVVDSFEDVFSAISELQGVYSKSYLDLDNIEALFGAIEMGVLLGKLANRDENSIQQLRNNLITLIFKTLETCIRFPTRNRQVLPPEPYGLLVEALRGKRGELRRSPPLELGFITFNYDLALDFALGSAGIRYTYSLPTEDSQDGLVPLLKLHGSINWGACSKCGVIVPYRTSEARFDLWDDAEYVRYNLGTLLPERNHCDAPLPLPPVIVPPTWNKTQYHGQLAEVWRRASAVLSEAENVFVVGYSLPETDAFFRYLYALGSEGKTRLKRFWVFDPDPSGTVEPRFRQMIGRGIENRFRFRTITFRDAIGEIGKVLHQN